MNGDIPSYKTYTKRVFSDGTIDTSLNVTSAAGKDSGILAIATGESPRALIVSQTESRIEPRIVVAQACLSNCPIMLTLVVENGSPSIAWNAEGNQH